MTSELELRALKREVKNTYVLQSHYREAPSGAPEQYSIPTMTDPIILKDHFRLETETMVLTGLGVDDSDLTGLKEFPIKRLFLSVNGITDVGLKELVGMKIQALDISMNKITDEALFYLEGLPLKTLNVSHTNVSDAGLRFLESFSLKNLSIMETNITEEGKNRFCENKPGVRVKYL